MPDTDDLTDDVDLLPCGCPAQLVADAGHQEGCDDAAPRSRVERLNDLCRRARDAQDRLGWAEPGSPEVAYGATDLARVVVELATELRTLAREIDGKA